MNILMYCILVCLLPFFANLSGYIVSIWASEELDSIKHYLDTAIRIVFIFILGTALSSLKFSGFLILIVFILYAISTYFWKYEKLNLLVFAILIILVPNSLILVLIFIYFLISTTLNYNKFHKTKTMKFSAYPLHAINFIKRYWTYYLFLLIIVLTLFVMLFLI